MSSIRNLSKCMRHMTELAELSEQALQHGTPAIAGGEIE
jgi:hypothetical protein